LDGIYDSNGDSVGVPYQSDDALAFTANNAGDYFIAVNGNSADAYQLNVSEIVDDFAANIKTTGLVAVDGSVTGEISSWGDQDWFQLALDAGQQVTIDLEGDPTDQGTLLDAALYGIYDSNGNLLDNTPNDDGGIYYNSRLVFTAADAGDYFIAAGAYGADTGSYLLSVTDGETPPPNDYSLDANLDPIYMPHNEFDLV
jgi:hypothetical protein